MQKTKPHTTRIQTTAISSSLLPLRWAPERRRICPDGPVVRSEAQGSLVAL